MTPYKHGKCLTTSRVVPDILISGGPSVMPGADWYAILVFLMLMESPRIDSTRKHSASLEFTPFAYAEHMRTIVPLPSFLYAI